MMPKSKKVRTYYKAVLTFLVSTALLNALLISFTQVNIFVLMIINLPLVLYYSSTIGKIRCASCGARLDRTAINIGSSKILFAKFPISDTCAICKNKLD